LTQLGDFLHFSMFLSVGLILWLYTVYWTYLSAHRFLCFFSSIFLFYVRQTKLVSSVVNFWAHYNIVFDLIDDSVPQTSWLSRGKFLHPPLQRTLGLSVYIPYGAAAPPTSFKGKGYRYFRKCYQKFDKCVWRVQQKNT